MLGVGGSGNSIVTILVAPPVPPIHFTFDLYRLTVEPEAYVIVIHTYQEGSVVCCHGINHPRALCLEIALLAWSTVLIHWRIFLRSVATCIYAM